MRAFVIPDTLRFFEYLSVDNDGVATPKLSVAVLSFEKVDFNDEHWKGSVPVVYSKLLALCKLVCIEV